MDRVLKSSFAMLVAGVFLAGSAGCQKKEGPAETAGREIDQAVDKAGRQIEKAGGKIQDAAKGDK